jgi:hypothetical protein
LSGYCWFISPHLLTLQIAKNDLTLAEKKAFIVANSKIQK